MHGIIRKFKFSKYADIRANDKHAYFECVLSKEPEGNGFVYLWLESDEESNNIVYIGKTEKRMKDRCKDHLNGFKGTSKSEAGLRHSLNICNGIKAAKHYEVYFRKSEVQIILGMKVSMCCVEEKALIQQVNPPWNK